MPTQRLGVVVVQPRTQAPLRVGSIQPMLGDKTLLDRQMLVLTQKTQIA